MRYSISISIAAFLFSASALGAHSRCVLPVADGGDIKPSPASLVGELVHGACEVPASSKPNRERRAGSVEDGSRRHGRAVATFRAHEPPVSQSPTTSVAAFRADELGRPPQPLKVVQAVRVGLEPRLELAKGTGVVNASPREIHGDRVRLTPVKWIAQKRLSGWCVRRYRWRVTRSASIMQSLGPLPQPFPPPRGSC